MMPSAFRCHRIIKDDLRAIEDYSHYRYTNHENRSLAKMALAEVRSYFHRYRKNFQTPYKLLPSRKLRKLSSFLFNLYNSTAAPFQYIEDLRDIEELGACLYCGLPKNFTVDHYLPREVDAFPHFSFLSFNLVPACSSCQSSKGSFYPKSELNSRLPAKTARRMRVLGAQRRTMKHKTGRLVLKGKNRTVLFRSVTAERKRAFFKILETRRIIHPYFDQFLNKRAFDLNLLWHQEIPTIRKFQWLPHLSTPQRALLSFHLKKLKVKDRSSSFIKRLHRSFAKSVVKERLNQEEIKARVTFMINYWREQAGVENSIAESYFYALLRDESKHALLAAKSTQSKQTLVSEARAIPARSKKQHDAKTYGF
jgi:5-methylcytosine-specific restriction endonuclease McrA